MPAVAHKIPTNKNYLPVLAAAAFAFLPRFAGLLAGLFAGLLDSTSAVVVALACLPFLALGGEVASSASSSTGAALLPRPVAFGASSSVAFFLPRPVLAPAPLATGDFGDFGAFFAAPRFFGVAFALAGVAFFGDRTGDAAALFSSTSADPVGLLLSGSSTFFTPRPFFFGLPAAAAAFFVRPFFAGLAFFVTPPSATRFPRFFVSTAASGAACAAPSSAVSTFFFRGAM
uniref:Uncharacterized protein n=1 Tax=Lutzomyia longipalpis TaxID=7200 RepID=A0A7G3B733_LUTLO